MVFSGMRSIINRKSVFRKKFVIYTFGLLISTFGGSVLLFSGPAFRIAGYVIINVAIILSVWGVAFSVQLLKQQMSKIASIQDSSYRLQKDLSTQQGEMSGQQKRLINRLPQIDNACGSVGKNAGRLKDLLAITKSLSSNVKNFKSDISPVKGMVQVAPRPTVQKSSVNALVKTDSPALAPSAPVKTNFPSRSVKVGVILDDFSYSAFDYEWMQYRLTPDNWDSILSTVGLDFIFVESAWAGNGGTWKYCLTGASAPRDSILSLLSEAKKLGIPTVFWNKEDPVHFHDFLTTASLFDRVYTTEGSVVEKYKMALGHDRVGVLPFAAQPAVHNPIEKFGAPRDRGIVFGGMYFRHKYPERREQMKYLLGAAPKGELDIYARNLGTDPNYAWPDELKEHTLPEIPYPEMLAAYRRYKVCVNVNSVAKSNTMCARRIFEATACGSAVISAATPAIDRYFPGNEIAQASNEAEATRIYKTYLRSEELRRRRVLAAQRVVWRNHTYTHRVDQIIKDLKLDDKYPPFKRPTVSLVCTTKRIDFLENIFKNVSWQTEDDVELILNLHGIDVEDVRIAELADKYDFGNYKVIRSPSDLSFGEAINAGFAETSGELSSKFDDDDYYGPNYIGDLVDAWLYSGADIVGKSEIFIYSEDSKVLVRSYKNYSMKFGSFVRGATLTGPTELMRSIGFGDLGTGEDSDFLKRAKELGKTIYSDGAYNFTYLRRDGSDHTYVASGDDMIASGEAVSFGDYKGFATA